MVTSLVGSIIGSRIEEDMKRRGGSRTASRPRQPSVASRLEEAYRLLGVSPRAGNAEVRQAYLRMAKKYHPDALRAQGLSEGMVGKATERMSRINAAWTLIREKRNI